MKERLAMSTKERDRLQVIKAVISGKKKWKEASEELGISIRQVGYVCARVRQEGDRGVIHGLCGFPSNNRLEAKLIDDAVKMVKERYEDFGPAFANEKLRLSGIHISTSSLRKAMIEARIWKAGRAKKRHRAWRERRSKVGMMTLVDGSDHDWFEGRCEKCVLLLFIDDATSALKYGEFVSSEDTKYLMLTTGTYMRKYGRMIAMYVDRDSIYKTNREATVEEALRAEYPQTQFTRAMGELNVKVICALSPQAKGRVERAFETLQDRLVKEMRLAGINTMESGTRFFNEVYIPEHNAKFAQEPARKGDAHRPLLKRHKLDEILSIRTIRTVCNDWTVRYKSSFFQLLADQPVRIRPRKKIEIEERLDGSIHLKSKGHYLKYESLGDRPYRPYYEKGYTDRGYTPKPGDLKYAGQVRIAI